MVGAIFSAASLGLAAIVAFAAIFKVLHWSQYRRAVDSWRLPQALERVALVGLPAIELVVSVLVVGAAIVDRWRVASLTALACLVTVLLVGQVAIWKSAAEPNCGCFGRSSRIGLASMSRTGACCVVATALVLAQAH